MKIRKLNLKDAIFMFEWMQDSDVVGKMKTDFKSKTIKDCESFIINSQNDSNSLHLAIVDDYDEYMGTVSLKHICNSNAEFGITVRKKAMGNGYSVFGMKNIIDIGFSKLKLKEIYWCVSPFNSRAIRFYEKNKFTQCECPNNVAWYTKEEMKSFYWFHILNNESLSYHFPSI